MIAGAANEIAVMANAVTQMTQDLRLSTVGTGAVEAIVEETFMLADIIEVPEFVAKHPTRGRHRQVEPPRGADRVRSGAGIVKLADTGTNLRNSLPQGSVEVIFSVRSVHLVELKLLDRRSQ